MDAKIPPNVVARKDTDRSREKRSVIKQRVSFHEDRRMLKREGSAEHYASCSVEIGLVVPSRGKATEVRSRSKLIILQGPAGKLWPATIFGDVASSLQQFSRGEFAWSGPVRGSSNLAHFLRTSRGLTSNYLFNADE